MKAAILETGRDLFPEKVRLGHGRFIKWVEAEFDMSLRTAQHYISAWELSRENAIFAHLPATAMYQLAAPSTPKSLEQFRLSRTQ